MSDEMSSEKQNRTVLYYMNDQASTVFPEHRGNTSADSVAAPMLYGLIQHLNLFSLY